MPVLEGRKSLILPSLGARGGLVETLGVGAHPEEIRGNERREIYLR